jgi:hypothetical protein
MHEFTGNGRTRMPPLNQAALALAAKGFAVFPLRPKTKEPYGDDKFYRTVGGYKCATRDRSLIEFWWARHPDNNIGIATGSVSAIWVLDVDGDEGRETLATLEEQHGQLPETVAVVTPGKINKKTGLHTGRGLHLYFRYPLGLDIRNAQDRDDLPGLDWRGNGGYVLVPPSAHPDGGLYAWSGDSADTFADAPQWLITLITSRVHPVGANFASVNDPDRWRTFISTPVEGSQRERAIARLYGVLLYRRVDPQLALELVRFFNTLRCDPPLDDTKVVHTTNEIQAREAIQREDEP